MDELIDLERGKCSSSKPTRLEGTAPFTQSLLLNSTAGCRSRIRRHWRRPTVPGEAQCGEDLRSALTRRLCPLPPGFCLQASVPSLWLFCRAALQCCDAYMDVATRATAATAACSHAASQDCQSLPLLQSTIQKGQVFGSGFGTVTEAPISEDRDAPCRGAGGGC